MVWCEAETGAAAAKLKEIEQALAAAPASAAGAFGAYLHGRTAETFAALATGGYYRGVYWPPRRQAKGKEELRPLLVKSGRLRAAAAGAPAVAARGALSFSVRLPYAAFVAKQRPFLFFEEETDAERLAEIIVRQSGLTEK